MMISRDPGRGALDRDERDEHAGDQQLVGRRVEERPERRGHVPAAGQVAVDEVRDRRDGEQDAAATIESVPTVTVVHDDGAP